MQHGAELGLLLQRLEWVAAYGFADLFDRGFQSFDDAPKFRHGALLDLDLLEHFGFRGAS
ncbi:MAG: hypothetical protein ACTHNY_02785 [Solirubrobacterales bacterium]